MTIVRQGRHFIMVGFVQWLVDWGVMVALSHSGVSVAAANIAGRLCGAALGFWLNGNITFAQDGRSPGWRQLGRYATTWCINAALSTTAVYFLNEVAGLRGAWLGKPLVDGTLAIGSFLASRHWVYR